MLSLTSTVYRSETLVLWGRSMDIVGLLIAEFTINKIDLTYMDTYTRGFNLIYGLR